MRLQTDENHGAQDLVATVDVDGATGRRRRTRRDDDALETEAADPATDGAGLQLQGADVLQFQPVDGAADRPRVQRQGGDVEESDPSEGGVDREGVLVDVDTLRVSDGDGGESAVPAEEGRWLYVERADPLDPQCHGSVSSHLNTAV